jgi:hypothetical protein
MTHPVTGLDLHEGDAETDLAAWIKYDHRRGEYEGDKYRYDSCRTTAGADHHRPLVLKTRKAYAAAHQALTTLGYEPSGYEPEPETYFNK